MEASRQSDLDIRVVHSGEISPKVGEAIVLPIFHSSAYVSGQEADYHSIPYLTDKERDAFGIGDGLLRVVIGIESADDLIADFEQALRSS